MKKSLIISIQQPEYFPWLGFFNKVANVDLVVLLDSVQFKKRYFDNRVRIRNHDGWQWLRIPIKSKGRFGQKISEVEIDQSVNWKSENLKALERNYRASPNFKNYFGEIEKLYQTDFSNLSTFNVEAIQLTTGLLGLKKDFLVASGENFDGKGSDLILDICKRLNASIYLSGKFGVDYLKEADFESESIRIIYQNFQHPKYNQLHGDFLPNMSVLDLLFNEGEKSLDVIKNGFTLQKLLYPELLVPKL